MTAQKEEWVQVQVHGREFFFLLTSLDGMFFSPTCFLMSLEDMSSGDSLLASSWSSVSHVFRDSIKICLFSTKTLADGRFGGCSFLALQDIRFSTCHDRPRLGFDVDLLNQRFAISEEQI